MARENVKGFRETLGIPGLEERVSGLANIGLIQQRGGLPYLQLHDPETSRPALAGGVP
jgi:hypothetical protein